MPVLRRVLRLFLCLYVAAIPFAVAPALALMAVGETLEGRFFGVAVFALAASLPMSYRFCVASPRGRRHRVGLALAVIPPILILPWLCLRAPSGEPLPGSGAASRFPGPLPYPRFAIANLVPEIDQVKLGILAAALLDPYLEWREVPHVLGVTLPLYHAMDADPAFHALGSVQAYAYSELFAGAFDSGHYYEYVPPHDAGERLPVLLFVHGSAGNFKSYLWLWKRFADRRKVLVLAPSFGFGNWDRAGGVEAIERVRETARRRTDTDPDRIYLVGLSNGGLGVSRAAARDPAGYAGVVFLSAVVEESALWGPQFLEGWKGRRVLFIHGEEDDRIPADYNADAARMLRDQGVDTTWKAHPGEDHFLFFSDPEAVFADMDGWIR